MPAPASRHVYWFAYFDRQEPSVRYRATYPLQFLASERGWSYDLVYPGYTAGRVFQFLKTYLRALLFRRPASVIVFQKLYTNGLYAGLLKLLVLLRPADTLYDIDDAEHTRHPDQTILFFMKRCSRVSAGSAALVDYARRCNPAAFLLTSPVPGGLPRQSADGPLRICWVGYFGAHRASLEALFFPALEQLPFPVHLVLIGVARPEERRHLRATSGRWPNVELELPDVTDWNDETALMALIAGCRVGVSPLLDTEFNRAKSAFKLKQYMACGLPVLASPVGENCRFLHDGRNGFRCAGAPEFAAALAGLHAMDDGRYRSLSAAALGTVSEFDLPSYCDTLLNQFNGGTAAPILSESHTR